MTSIHFADDIGDDDDDSGSVKHLMEAPSQFESPHLDAETNDNNEQLNEDTNVDFNNNDGAVEDEWLRLPQTPSILTRITLLDTGDGGERLPLCLQLAPESNSQIFLEDSTSFVPNTDPGIAEFMNLKEMDNEKGWEKYIRECYKYSLPRITGAKEVLHGRTQKFDLSVSSIRFTNLINFLTIKFVFIGKMYCPQSIGIWLPCEIFGEDEIIVTDIDLSSSPFTESGCYTLGDCLGQSYTLEHLNLNHCKYAESILAFTCVCEICLKNLPF